MTAKLSLLQKRRLARDGYVLVPGMVPRARIDAALRDINHRLGAAEHPGKDASADPRDYLSEYTSSPSIMNLMNATPLHELAESLLGPGQVEPCSQAQVALRFPTRSNDTPPRRDVHVDGMYDKTTPQPIVRYTLCAGVFLSDAPRPGMGNLVVYPRTHHQLARLFKKKGLGALKNGVEKSVPLPPPVSVTGRAGDVVLFHFQLAHDKARNDSPLIRYMAYFRLWHIKAWRDKSSKYLKRALTDIWLEWPAMRGVHGT